MISNHGSHTKLVLEDPQEQGVPREFALKDLAHMAAPYGSHLCEPATFGLELPYASIGGPGFERLCFHLLLSQGHKPRFFGRSGQAQYGIDLIVSDGERSTVYQCKNKREYAADDLRFDLDLFAKKWLVERPDLRTPDRFVLCCTARLDLRGDWEVAKQDFFEEHGITVEEWHRDTLDGWLRREPDIVADLFGNDVAERFCERDGWNDGLFRPLLPGSGEKDVERYLALRAERRLVHDPATVAGFRQILASQGLILIEGPSGNGKTMAALDLACSFHDGEWRVFFVSLRNEVDEQLLFAGIKDRCVRPTLFILDDCHRDLATVERAVSRVRYALRGRACGLVLTAQTAADDSESLAIEPTNFVEDCREQQRTLTITPTIDQYRQILARVRPSLGGLSQKSLERLYAMTAHDLAVLDMVLDTMEDQALADVDLLSSTFPRVLRRYFGREKVYAPNLKALAAIAQFDIAVPMSLLPDPLERAENLGAAERLLVRTGLPTRGQHTSVAFIHASAAEMIFRALSWADVDPDWMSAAATAIACHLASLESVEAFNQALGLLFRTRLRLADDSNLKLKVSASPEISARIERQLDAVPLAILSLATFLTRSLGQSLPYADWLAKRLESLIVQQGPTSEKDLQQIGMWLRSLSAANPILHASLEVRLGGEPMLRLIRANGTIFELFMILRYSTPGFAAGLINALDPPTVAALIDKTINEVRSIGTLDLALRELAERNMPEPDGRTQLAALEAHLGGEPMLRLIQANGTIFELFRILQYSTPGFAAGLINALDPPTVAALIDKTITERRSIGTLSFALRELAERNMPEPDGRTQLTALEAHLSGEPMLRLIRANGTIFELFKILENSTPGFAAGLINALDPPTVVALIDKTIAEERSIGTLSFSLRELQKSDPISKAKLERAIGVEGFWRLVLGAGDLNDLSYLLADLTGEFRESALAPDAAPKSATWAKLACRGGFYAISRFVKDSIDNLPPETRRQFEAAMTEVLPEIAGASAWPDLSSGLAIAEQIAHAPLRAALETAAFERIDRQDIDDLGFNSFIDAANGLYHLWRRREALRPDLGRRLWSLLPERRAWPEDPLLFVGARFLLQIGRSEEISQLDAEKLLLSFSKMPPSVEVEKTLPGPLYLFSWNLFALWYARGKSISDQFAELQSKEFWTRVEDVVAKHAVRRGRNQDKLNVLALAGLLTLLLSGRTNRLTHALRGHITGISWLIKEAEDLTFIPAILALKGLWLIDPHQARFSADRRARLLAKAAEYDERGPAIDFLCDWLRDDRRHRPLAGKDRTGRK